jgi:hypothetical protein
MSHTKDEFKMFTYLGQKIKDEALKDSACMREDLREIIGDIQAFAIFSGDASMLDFIMPLRIMARYMWPRMEVTDLSLMLGENIINVSFKPKSNESESSATPEEIADEDL